jgi:hypothetical protein
MRTKRNIRYKKLHKTYKQYQYSGGNNKYILQEINHLYNDDYNKVFPNDSRDSINGEFVVHKEFKVILNNKSNNIYGYVIQKVEKQTNAYTIIDGVETKIKNISKFTSEYVNYMNESYYELFFIINGESTHGDNFQNGAILEYTYNKTNNSYGPDDKTNTKGIIKIKGTSWFIKSDKKDVISNYNLINDKININNNNSNKTISILGINWSLKSDTPANGLPYLDISKSSKINMIPRNSNLLIHNVTVNWDTTHKINNKSSPYTTSEFEKIA